MIPVSECRGGIIAACGSGVNYLLAYAVCVIANLLPLPFVMLFMRRIMTFLKRFKWLGKIINKYEKKLEHKSKKVQAGSLIALFLFVAVPLPGTGGWTGAIIADLLNLRMKHALPVIAAGVLCAGIIVTLLVYGLVDGVFLKGIFGL